MCILEYTSHICTSPWFFYLYPPKLCSFHVTLSAGANLGPCPLLIPAIRYPFPLFTLHIYYISRPPPIRDRFPELTWFSVLHLNSPQPQFRRLSTSHLTPGIPRCALPPIGYPLPKQHCLPSMYPGLPPPLAIRNSEFNILYLF